MKTTTIFYNGTRYADQQIRLYEREHWAVRSIQMIGHGKGKQICVVYEKPTD